MADLQVFNFQQDLSGNQQDTTFNVLSSALGDGYVQKISVGINNRKSRHAYQRTARRAEILQIKSFLDEHKGAKPFLYSTLLDGQIKVIAGDYTLSLVEADIYKISTTFEQVF